MRHQRFLPGPSNLFREVNFWAAWAGDLRAVHWDQMLQRLLRATHGQEV